MPKDIIGTRIYAHLLREMGDWNALYMPMKMDFHGTSGLVYMPHNKEKLNALNMRANTTVHGKKAYALA